MGGADILAEAQLKVNNLLEVQKQLHSVLLGEGMLATEPRTSPAGSAPSPGLRGLLGRAVRVQQQQQRELDSLRDAIREERSVAWSAQQHAQASAADSASAREKAEELQTLLATERTERMESESAALEREEQLQAKIDELEEKERRRLEMEKMLAEAEPAPDVPVNNITVAAAAPAAPVEGFDASAGGFSL